MLAVRPVFVFLFGAGEGALTHVEGQGFFLNAKRGGGEEDPIRGGVGGGNRGCEGVLGGGEYQDNFATPNPQVCPFYFLSRQKEKSSLRKPDSPYLQRPGNCTGSSFCADRVRLSKTFHSRLACRRKSLVRNSGDWGGDQKLIEKWFFGVRNMPTVMIIDNLWVLCQEFSTNLIGWVTAVLHVESGSAHSLCPWGVASHAASVSFGLDSLLLLLWCAQLAWSFICLVVVTYVLAFVCCLCLCCCFGTYSLFTLMCLRS